MFIYTSLFIHFLYLCSTYVINNRSVIPVMINTVTLALLHAGIFMYDLAIACSVGLVNKEICIDLTQVEENSGGCYLPVAINARTKELIYIQLDARLSINNLQETIDLAIESGCNVIQTYVSAHMKDFIHQLRN